MIIEILGFGAICYDCEILRRMYSIYFLLGCEMDILTKEQRRKNMQHIKSKDTKIEILLRKALWHRGIRYRKNYTALPGKPDIVITKYKIAIFCDSEFFHGKDWEVLKPQLEKGNYSNFWVGKISKNLERDKRIDKELLLHGWTVIHFWGKDIIKNTDECVKVVEETIFDLILAEEKDYLELDYKQR